MNSRTPENIDHGNTESSQPALNGNTGTQFSSIQTINDSVQAGITLGKAPGAGNQPRDCGTEASLLNGSSLEFSPTAIYYIEGVPGLAKTLALKTLADAIQTEFRRIQFTPDMLPADIVGTEIYNPRERFLRC